MWGDVQYKDKQFALAILNQHMDKVVVHVDDKGVAGKYNSYNVEWKGKDLHITVHLDFTNYPQRPNLADDKPGVGHIDWMVWDHLDEVGNITYELRKANMINSEGSALNTAKKWLKAKVTKVRGPFAPLTSLTSITEGRPPRSQLGLGLRPHRQDEGGPEQARGPQPC